MISASRRFGLKKSVGEYERAILKEGRGGGKKEQIEEQTEQPFAVVEDDDLKEKKET